MNERSEATARGWIRSQRCRLGSLAIVSSQVSGTALAAGSCSRSQPLPGNVLFAKLRLDASGGAGNTVRYQAEPGNEGTRTQRRQRYSCGTVAAGSGLNEGMFPPRFGWQESADNLVT